MSDDFKLAADELRQLATWKDRALKAETKLASYVRKDRIEAIVKKAEVKGAVLPQGVNLMKCSEDELANIERALELISPAGALKLASVEGGTNIPSSTPTRQRTELEEFERDPTGFSVAGS